MNFSYKITLATLLIIIFLGAVLRFSTINEASLWIDEGFSITSAQAVLNRGKPLLDSGRAYSSWTTDSYLIAATTKTFGLDPYNPWTARLPAAIFGLLSVVLSYFLTTTIFQDKKGLITATGVALLTSLLSWQVAWSQQARGYALAQLSVTTTIFCFLKIKPATTPFLFLKNNKLPLLGIILSVLTGYLTTPLTLLIIPAILIYILTINITGISAKIKNKHGKVMLLTIIFLLAASAFYTLPQLTTLRTGAVATGYLGFLTTSFLVVTVGAVATFMTAVNTGKDFQKILFLTYSFVVPLIILVLYYDTEQFRYLFPFIIPLLIMFCYFVSSITVALTSKPLGQMFWRLGQRYIVIGQLIISLFLITVLTYPTLHLTTIRPPLLEEGSPQPNFREAFDIIANHSNQEYTVISPYPHLHQIYLNQKGYSLMISLSGRENEIESRLVDPKECIPPTNNNTPHEHYICAPIIKGDALNSMLSSSSGFIIIDEMALSRNSEDISIIKQHPSVELIYHSHQENLGNVWLYQF